MRLLHSMNVPFFAGAAALIAAAAAGCGGNVEIDLSTGGAGGGATTTTSTDPGPKPLVDKVDLLLAVDNSRSMADKQKVLALAVPDLVASLVSPPCRDAQGSAVPVPPGFGPLDPCPAGSQREYSPVLDIHIGIVSSSLGGHGSDACSTSGAGKQSNNDMARLLARVDPTQATEVETYQNLKFLAWDPAQKLAPPGEADVDADSAADSNGTALVPTLRDMVLGVGQIGCGYEAQLESWYRFLIDPTPPQEVTLDADGKVLLVGIDEVLLSQRKAFLRPDSALVILMLTDENDCSIREQGQFYYAAQLKASNGAPFHLPRARAICETDPGDVCCFSCGQSGPKDQDGNPLCDIDPACKDASGKTVYLDDITDNINLRCFEQKRRFGIDFLYDIDRYVDGLRSQTVTDRNGQVVPNPIYSDLDPGDANSNIRSPEVVILAGLVGVPWQDVARTSAGGVPDLLAGLDDQGKPVGGFKSAAQMLADVPGQGYDTWAVILGDHEGYGKPLDPLMIESFEKRTGVSPITGEALVDSSQPLANKANGHEQSIPKRDDLQYACIFPLVKVEPDGTVVPDVHDCSVAGNVACDCEDASNDSPVCEVNPATGKPTNQVRAKLYPGLRHLAVLRGLGDQGVVASGCPAQMSNPTQADFGYRPAMASVVERLKVHFN